MNGNWDSRIGRIEEEAFRRYVRSLSDEELVAEFVETTERLCREFNVTPSELAELPGMAPLDLECLPRHLDDDDL